jgi:hypothetical protein
MKQAGNAEAAFDIASPFEKPSSNLHSASRWRNQTWPMMPTAACIGVRRPDSLATSDAQQTTRNDSD